MPTRCSIINWKSFQSQFSNGMSVGVQSCKTVENTRLGMLHFWGEKMTPQKRRTKKKRDHNYKRRQTPLTCKKTKKKVITTLKDLLFTDNTSDALRKYVFVCKNCNISAYNWNHIICLCLITQWGLRQQPFFIFLFCFFACVRNSVVRILNDLCCTARSRAAQSSLIRH